MTGVPRSGTTWLARELAARSGGSMPGREPMNPRGGQFALGGTVRGWTALEDPSARQQRLLRRCYRGLEPRALSRYGVRQWAAPLPGVPVVVKDPFALASVPAVARCTGARPVVVYRHPGAVLASYRRMGWTADTAEVRALPGGPAGPAPRDDVEAMAEFWTHLHQRVLRWLPEVPGALVVSHAELALGGAPALDALLRACGLRRCGPGDGRPPSTRPAGPGGTRREGTGEPARGALHGFARAADEVAEGWRSRLRPGETARLEAAAAEVLAALDAVRLRLPGDVT